MYLREVLKRAAFMTLGSRLRVGPRAKQIQRSHGRLVLNLHRISEPDGSTYTPMRPRIFEDLLIYLKKNFSIQTFCDGRHGPAVILSFDDGYKDFLETAVPIMAKHAIRCNHNIIPECVETGRPPLNVLLQDFVGKAPRDLVRRLDVPGFKMGGPNLGSRLSSYIKMKPMAQQRALAEHLVPQMFFWDAFRPTAMMRRADILQIAGIHEIGAHSFSHASMETETIDYLREDVLRCRAYFDTLGLEMNIYAFPNGSANAEHVKTVQSMGVSHVLLGGNAFDIRDDQHFRFTFHAKCRSEMRFKALGGMRPPILNGSS